MTDVAPTKLAEVRPIASDPVEIIDLLERMLAQAKAGEIRAVAVMFERKDGFTSHEAAFSSYANRTAMVGRLYVAAQHITLNEILEWQPA